MAGLSCLLLRRLAVIAIVAVGSYLPGTARAEEFRSSAQRR